MAVIRWEPARELQTIQQEMNRLFGTFFDTQTGTGVSAASRRWVPPMDLLEEGEHFVLRTDLPGVREEDVTIELEGEVLTIAGQRRTGYEDQREGYHRVERAFGHFTRSLTLPEGVEAEAIEAQFENGVLEVRIPKPEQRKPRKVEIKAGRREEPALEGTASAA